MTRLKTSAAALLLGMTGIAAQAAYIDFAAMANGATGESAWSPLTLTYADFGLTVTATNGTAPAYAYLDRGTGGLGVCKALNASGTAKLNAATNSGANLCLVSSDDNVTRDEALQFVFSTNVVIESIWFNNLHDGDRRLQAGDLVNIQGVGTALTEGVFSGSSMWSWTTSPYLVAAGTPFSIGYNNENFYVHAMSVRAVPEPGMLSLFALGLAGLAATRRRR